MLRPRYGNSLITVPSWVLRILSSSHTVIDEDEESTRWENEYLVDEEVCTVYQVSTFLVDLREAY